ARCRAHCRDGLARHCDRRRRDRLRWPRARRRVSLARVRASGRQDPRAGRVADGRRGVGRARIMNAPTIGQIRFQWRSGALLVATSAVGIAAFTWPLFTRPHGSENLAHAGDAPWVFIALVPLLIGILLSELADGALDAKAVAMLGVLVACGAALRAPGTGVTGFTGVFFLLIPGGRVFGRGFGFVQGALTMFASALLTGGVGPWLPFEML